MLLIGAGTAGLTVANALAHAAVDCVVLEARRRIGGRLYTADLGDSGWTSAAHVHTSRRATH